MRFKFIPIINYKTFIKNGKLSGNNYLLIILSILIMNKSNRICTI